MHDILSECITHLMTESEDNVTKKVSDLDRVLIEQALFCTDGTDDCGENFLIEALCRYLDNDNPSYKLTSLLTESISYSSELSMYKPLIEAISEIKESEKSLKEEISDKSEDKTKSLLEKIKDSIQKSVRWWFEVSPDSKKNTLKLILRVIYKAFKFAVMWKLGEGHDVAMAINTLGLETGIEAIPYVNTSSPLFRPAIQPKYISIFKTPLINVVSVAGEALFAILEFLYKQAEYSINIKYVDENLDKYNKLIAEVETKLDNCENSEEEELLKKYLDELYKCWAKLYDFKKTKTTKEVSVEVKKRKKEMKTDNK